MVRRYAVLETDKDFETLWNDSIKFWYRKHGKLSKQYISTDPMYRKLIVKLGFSTRIYASLIYMTFIFDFYHDPDDNFTAITIELRRPAIGQGAFWRIPQVEIDNWTRSLGLPYVKLNRTTPPYSEQLPNE